jgi:hypothetical protein
MTMTPLEMLETARRYSPADQKVNVKFTKSGFSKVISGELFEGVELSFDPEFGNVWITCRGYEVIIELGNTKDWTTKCADGGFDGALSVSALVQGDDLKEDEETGEIVENNLFNHVLPTLETNNQ